MQHSFITRITKTKDGKWKNEFSLATFLRALVKGKKVTI